MNETLPAPLSPVRPARRATVERVTRETRIRVEIDLDGQGRADIRTGIGFLDHMLEQIARHGLIDPDREPDYAAVIKGLRQ